MRGVALVKVKGCPGREQLHEIRNSGPCQLPLVQLKAWSPINQHNPRLFFPFSPNTHSLNFP